MNLPLLAVSEGCQRLLFTDFGSVGACFVEGTVFGDVTLMGIIIFIMVAFLIVRYNFPIQTILPVGIALSYAMYIMSGAEVFLGFMILGLIIGGAMLVIGILQHVNR